MKLEFVDAQVMAKEHPDTFSAPDEIELSCITAGAFVKVCVDKERFWVFVTAVTPTVITGTIDNDLVYTRYHGLRYEDLITFEPRHVFNILDSSEAKFHG